MGDYGGHDAGFHAFPWFGTSRHGLAECETLFNPPPPVADRVARACWITCKFADFFKTKSSTGPAHPAGPHPKRGTLLPKSSPRRLQDRPRALQDAFKSGQDGKMKARSHKDANLSPTCAHHGPTWTQLDPTWPHRGALHPRKPLICPQVVEGFCHRNDLRLEMP